MVYIERKPKVNPMGDANKVQVPPSLLDPITCGENLERLASRMAELAPVLCVDCAEYHVKFAMTRCVAPGKSIGVDRSLLIKHVQQILMDAARRSEGALQIVIAGAADTGILATCAHAAAVLGAQIQSRCRFTVLDRCKTPLTLCAEFAAAHALQVHTAQIDLSAATERFDADLIIAHSFLRFISRHQQTTLLKNFDAWLKPQGRIIVSQSIRPRGSAHFDKEANRLQSSLALAKAAVAKGAITIGDDAEALLTRMHDSGEAYLEQPGEIASADELRALLLSAGLREYSIDLITKEISPAGAGTFERIRAVAVFGSSRGA